MFDDPPTFQRRELTKNINRAPTTCLQRVVGVLIYIPFLAVEHLVNVMWYASDAVKFAYIRAERAGTIPNAKSQRIAYAITYIPIATVMICCGISWLVLERASILCSKVEDAVWPCDVRVQRYTAKEKEQQTLDMYKQAKCKN